MEKFLLKVINQDGEAIWNDLVRLKWTHLDSFKEFSKKNNVTIPLSSDQKAALALASINYTSILKHKFGYVFYLPETCSEKQIEYLDNNLEFYRQEEQNDNIITTAIFSKEKMYYNHQNYRDLQIEEQIDILEGRKKEQSSSIDLLKEELRKQKKRLVETKKL